MDPEQPPEGEVQDWKKGQDTGMGCQELVPRKSRICCGAQTTGEELLEAAGRGPISGELPRLA